MRCDLGNLGDVRPGARTGMTRTLRFIVIKTGKNEKQKEKKAQRPGAWSVFFPWLPLQARRRAQDRVWEQQSWGRERVKGFTSAM